MLEPGIGTVDADFDDYPWWEYEPEPVAWDED